VAHAPPRPRTVEPGGVLPLRPPAHAGPPAGPALLHPPRPGSPSPPPTIPASPVPLGRPAAAHQASAPRVPADPVLTVDCSVRASERVVQRGGAVSQGLRNSEACTVMPRRDSGTRRPVMPVSPNLRERMAAGRRWTRARGSRRGGSSSKMRGDIRAQSRGEAAEEPSVASSLDYPDCRFKLTIGSDACCHKCRDSVCGLGDSLGI
jgi:hypothetical protein